jgi:hypothetical protein
MALRGLLVPRSLLAAHGCKGRACVGLPLRPLTRTHSLRIRFGYLRIFTDIASAHVGSVGYDL